MTAADRAFQNVRKASTVKARVPMAEDIVSPTAKVTRVEPQYSTKPAARSRPVVIDQITANGSRLRTMVEEYSESPLTKEASLAKTITGLAVWADLV
jgi:hypothetical protein